MGKGTEHGIHEEDGGYCVRKGTGHGIHEEDGAYGLGWTRGEDGINEEVDGVWTGKPGYRTWYP